jgi:WD40 repeat protein
MIVIVIVSCLQAYLYDIRSGSYLHKLTGHSETVTNVAFHHQYPQVVLFTGSVIHR